MNVLTRGDLSSIRWVCSPLRHAQPSSPGKQLCTVYYASLNFRDIMLATGKLSPDSIPGTREPVWDGLGRGTAGLRGEGSSRPCGRGRPLMGCAVCPQGSGPAGTACWAWSSQASMPVASV